MHAWMHSCGHVNDIVGEWIDCGLDVVNLQQPRNLGIEEIGARYRGKICFETPLRHPDDAAAGTDERDPGGGAAAAGALGHAARAASS